jgi:hypothetical protein
MLTITAIRPRLLRVGVDLGEWQVAEPAARCGLARRLVDNSGVLEDAGRLRRETRQPERGRAGEIWIPVLAHAA